MLIKFDKNISNYECEVVYLKQNEKNVLAKLYNFKAKLAITILVNNQNKLQLLVGLGDKEIEVKHCEKIIKTIADILNKNNIKSVILTSINSVHFSNNQFVKLASKIIIVSDYRVQKIELKQEKPNSLQEIAFNCDTNHKYLQIGTAIASGINLCRDLADKPSNVCTPSYLAQTAIDMAKKFKLKCDILTEKEMQKLGMNSLLSVSKGSIQPPKLITLSYTGDGDESPVILIGKGVTFDSGGISLKPGSSMDEMKYDMGGAASVLGVMHAIADIGAKVNLIVVVPTVENMPAHNASKPGDVVKSMSGQTIEILNTDAEGRLILCDALTYVEKFNPAIVIDIATLTGAVIVALGKHHSGIMGNNQQLVDSLIKLGKGVNDTLWQLPLEEEFDELLQSNFADMANIGGREAGSITAGCFLARFTKNYNWAHLDIAGTAWHSGKNKGATGRPVALLCEYLLNY